MFFQVSVVLGIMLSYAFGPLVEYCPQNPLKALFNVPCCLWATIHAIVSYLMAVPESQVLIIEDDDDEMKFLMDDGYANIHETLIEIFKQIVWLRVFTKYNLLFSIYDIISVIKNFNLGESLEF